MGVWRHVEIRSKFYFIFYVDEGSKAICEGIQFNTSLVIVSSF